MKIDLEPEEFQASVTQTVAQIHQFATTCQTPRPAAAGGADPLSAAISAELVAWNAQLSLIAGHAETVAEHLAACTVTTTSTLVSEDADNAQGIAENNGSPTVYV